MHRSRSEAAALGPAAITTVCQRLKYGSTWEFDAVSDVVVVTPVVSTSVSCCGELGDKVLPGNAAVTSVPVYIMSEIKKK